MPDTLSQFYLNSHNLLLIGNGRLARHLSEYFRLLGLSHQSWNRKEHSVNVLKEQLAQAKTVLLTISDGSILSFTQEFHRFAPKAHWLHFSGALEIPQVHSFHPLMTFAGQLYELKVYQDVPFITTGTLPLAEAIPSLRNPCYRISPEKKARYHALCVLSGNFTTLLWQKFIEELRSWDLPKEIGIQYARQTIENVFQDPAHALTGPLARKDLATQEKNLAALGSDPYADIYRGFQAVVQKIEVGKNNDEERLP